MFALTILLFSASIPALASTNECRTSSEHALQQLKSPGADPDQRSESGRCLTHFYLDKPEVAQALLKIIKDPREDILLREDLIEAFADSTLRRKIKVEQQLSRKLDTQDNAAVKNTISGASDLLAVTNAVMSMDETIMVTRLEPEFFRAFSDIAIDDSNHVILRETAVAALEKVSEKTVKSGIYDDRNIRLAQETLRTVSARDDNSSFYTGASQAYNRLASSGLPHFSNGGGRMLSSIPRE